jgi:TolB-like protein
MDSSLTATFNLGTYYLKQNQFDKAELLLESTYPEIPSDNYHIALLKNQKTLPQNAFVFSKYNQALYLWGLGKQESAIKILTSIPSAQETLAWMYYSTGQYDNCTFVSDYGKALIAYQTNNTGAAFTHIQNYLHQKPNHLEAWVLLAKLSITKKYWIQAENILTYVLRLNPNFTPALKEIRTVFHQLNKPEKLKAVLLRAAEKSHLNKDKNYRLGIKTFKNLSDSSLNWIANSIPQTLTQLFHSESKYNVLERREFQKILTEKGYLQSLDANYQQGLSLGLSHILLGSYQVQGEQIKISARIVETESGKVLESSNVLGHLDSLSYWENQLALQLLGRSKPNLLNQIVSLDAKKQNAMAQQFLFEGNVAKAKALSKQAITSDPNILGVMDEVVLTDDADTKSHVIAVMPFENLTQNTKMQWLSIGAQDALISDLKRYGGLYTIERSQVQSLLEEQALSLSGAIAPESAPKIGALLAAGVTILGSFQTEGDQVKISARLVKVETGDIFLAESVQGSKDEVLSLQQKLAMQLLKGLKISTEQNKKIRRKDPLALKTLSDELKWDTQQQVLTETIVEYRKEQGSHWGASLWTTSILSTAGASLSYYYHLKDDDDYNNATNTSQSTLLGDQAESSYDRSLYLASSALFSWALMGGYYLIFGESND